MGLSNVRVCFYFYVRVTNRTPIEVYLAIRSQSLVLSLSNAQALCLWTSDLASLNFHFFYKSRIFFIGRLPGSVLLDTNKFRFVLQMSAFRIRSNY